ncbi:nucleotidyltransferase domain-containing protein [Geothrix sp.]|uniref:nucleotidyltransferase domain-containing protein n=1 Tax=Geothrix sp. TaxID=1962974 RepID=UPI0025BD7C04|nr:nucleotidyltransferase domain-containing protein [Geothrix sp.]
MDKAIDILKSHARLMERGRISSARIEVLRREIARIDILNDDKISIFCAGSIARGEYGGNSDLDILLTFNGTIDVAEKLESDVKSALHKINNDLGYPPLSDSGRFLKLHPIGDLVSKTGSPLDDSENRFTVRLLLLLEGIYLSSNNLFESHKNEILKNYFRDQKAVNNYIPYFLINDILRYWRTLCLNYEDFRCERSRPWRKKSINLKFSRMLTVFATVLPIISTPIQKIEECFELTNYKPLERMALGIDALGSEALIKSWKAILDHYEFFLNWKESKEIDRENLSLEDRKIISGYSTGFSNFLYDTLTNDKIDPILRKALIL